MEPKKISLLKSWVRALGSYTVINFLWTAIWSIGISLSKDKTAEGRVHGYVNELADYFVLANFAIILFSLVFGFSFLIFEVKNMSAPAKRTAHIFINYAAAMVCVYLLHSNAEAKPSAWIVLIFMYTVVYFLLYGLAMLGASLIRRFNRR